METSQRGGGRGSAFKTRHVGFRVMTFVSCFCSVLDDAITGVVQQQMSQSARGRSERERVNINHLLRIHRVQTEERGYFFFYWGRLHVGSACPHAGSAAQHV